MKQFNAIKLLLVFALLSGTFSVNAQIHPKAFGAITAGATTFPSNWYKDYVGLRFEVTSPSVIAGDKQYTTANDGSGGATLWGGVVTTPMVNVPIVMDTTSDSFGANPFPYSMAGKIAVIWRGPIGSGAVAFSTKAYYAQQAGAVAIVIINEYPGQGPIGMAESALPGPGSITIPVFMIGNLDGIAISGQYWAGQPVKMTISPWGLGLRNDIGFVPGGAAAWHSYAVPYDQIPAGRPLPAPYKGFDGAFIANYGISNAINVRLAATLDYTANGTSTKVQLHTDTASGEATFYGLGHTPTPDSIIAMFTTPEYNFAPATTGRGKYDLTYTLMSDTANQNHADTSVTLSFYTSDSVYSKGRYDFTKNEPISTIWEGVAGGTTDFVWGNMYYVAHGHDAIRSIQFSLYNPSGTTGPITAAPMNLFVFKWNDGSNGLPQDSIMQQGELEQVAQGTYSFATSDTSGMVFKCTMGDSTGLVGIPAYLDSGAWYYVAAEVPGGYFLGCDGSIFSNLYPRIYGRFQTSGYMEYGDVEAQGDASTFAGSTGASAPVAFPGGISFVNSVDSFVFSSQKGLIPSVALIVTSNPDTSHVHDGVQQIKNTVGEVKLYPNPANEHLNIAVSFPQSAPTVTYTVLDGLGRFVSKVSHNNVQQETYEMSTSNLAAGTYFLIVNENGKSISKKFTIVR